jgi:NAD(P)-dependent dehydrogenase (short-subunit alcohol dehydrogenase family)
MERLKNKIAVITGGNSGIGLATAQHFVQEGAFVFITGRRQAELDKAVAAIGKNITAVQGDVSNLDDIDRLYAIVKQAKGGIDILFANAGILEPLPTAQATPEHYDRVFDINARGVYFTVQKALPLLRDNASIIVNGSGAWTRGIPVYSTYAATKAALRSFVRTWTAELAPRGIRANIISPGPIDTPIIDVFPAEQRAPMTEQLLQMIPMGRIGHPDEIADAVVFLASSESSYISGIDLPVDGGLNSV